MARLRKYKTEEERKAAKKEYLKRYYQENKEKMLEYHRQWRKDNPEKERERNKRYCHEHVDKVKEATRRWREANAVKVKEYQKRWIAEYRNTPIGRAFHLVNNYQRDDKKYNRGECTLTAKWIVDNIFNKPCHYNCGETDWKKIGCDRIDNSKPHTPDNVVPCCEECNVKRGTKTYEEFLMTIPSDDGR